MILVMMALAVYVCMCVSAADFGLAKMYGVPLRPMTPKVVTLWLVHVADTYTLFCHTAASAGLLYLLVFLYFCPSVTRDILRRDKCHDKEQ